MPPRWHRSELRLKYCRKGEGYVTRCHGGLGGRLRLVPPRKTTGQVGVRAPLHDIIPGTGPLAPVLRRIVGGVSEPLLEDALPQICASPYEGMLHACSER